MGKVMKQHVTGRSVTRLASLLLAGGLSLAAISTLPAGAADIEEDPAASVRLSQKNSRNCTESCTAECRAERTDCTERKADEKISCRAQFQICVRRCVVTCSPN